MSELKGRCLCGAVRFSVHSAPLSTRICWCRDCQHLAANGTVNFIVPAAVLHVTGELTEYTRKADSGNEIVRQFCPQCGSHLFARTSARPHLRVVRAGNLDDPGAITPTMNIWTKSAPAWACFNTALEQVEQQPVIPPSSPR